MIEITNITRHTVIVIGAGYAGLMAAIRLAHQARHQSVQITLINASDHFVERIRLHQLATHQRLPAHPLKRLLAGTGISFVQGLVTAIQPAEKSVSLLAAGQVQTMTYDTLVYALGSHADWQRIPGVSEYAYTLDPNSAVKLMAKLEVLNRGNKALIVGGGLTGIEAAAEIAERYPSLRVTLVTAGHLGSDLSKAGQEYLRHAFTQLKIEVMEQTPISAILLDQALTTAGEALQFDVCVFAAGFIASPLAQQAGFAVNSNGQIVVDSFLRSVSHPDVFAVGDGATLADSAGLPLRMACATAMPMAAHAADNISAMLAGRSEDRFAFGYVLRCISLGRARGLVQMVSSSDAPRDRIYTGRQGAFIKELVCRYTFGSLQLARWSSKLNQ